MTDDDLTPRQTALLHWLDSPENPGPGEFGDDDLAFLQAEIRLTAAFHQPATGWPNLVGAALPGFRPQPSPWFGEVRAFLGWLVVIDTALVLLLGLPFLLLDTPTVFVPAWVILAAVTEAVGNHLPLLTLLALPATALWIAASFTTLLASFVRPAQGRAAILTVGITLAAAVPSNSYARDLVQVGNDVTLVVGEEADTIFVLWGDAQVLGNVTGDLVVLGGDADVSGQIGGTAFLWGGDLRLGPEARIAGDRILLGGEERPLGAVPPPAQPGVIRQWGGAGVLRAFRLLTATSTAGFATISGFLMLALWPERVRNIRRTVEAAPGTSLLLGWLVGFGLGVCLVLLAWTIIGLLAWPLVLGATLVLWAAGAAGLAEVAGDRLPFPSAFRTRGTSFVLGSFLLAVLLGGPWAWGGWPAVFALLAATAVGCLALGASLLSVLGRSPYGGT